MNLRILLIGPYPARPQKIIGGVEAVTTTLASALSSDENVDQVDVLCFTAEPASRNMVQVNGKLRVWYFRKQNRLALPTRSILELFIARRLATSLMPDIVHGQGIGTVGDIATRVNQKSIVTVHGLVHVEARLSSAPNARGHLRLWMIERMVRGVLSRAKVVISTSDYDAQAVGQLVSGKHRRIYNPVSSEFFTNPCHNSSPRILYAGMLIPRKNLIGLLHAFNIILQSIPTAELILVGPSCDKFYASEINNYVLRMHMTDRVQIVGHVDNSELICELRRARALVLFSNEETSPTIIAQAMAAGKPVVASRVGGVPEMISDGESGFLVQPGDEKELAERLVMLLGSADLCGRMGACAHEQARERFDPDAVAHRTLDAYHLAMRC